MDVVFNTLLIFVLLVNNVSMVRNFHIPHSYLHSLAVQHGDYQHDDSYSSEGIVLRAHHKHNHHSASDCSESDHHFKASCKCNCRSCTKNPKSCCKEFCEKHCPVQSNILVVPYPVPFMVQTMTANQASSSDRPELTLIHASPSSIATEQKQTTQSTTPPMMSTTTAIVNYEQLRISTASLVTIPNTRKTMEALRYTLSSQNLNNYYSKGLGYKRFRILSDNRNRRNFPGNQRPSKFEELPKYGIVPIPENLAMSLMHQIRSDQRNNQFLRRRAVNENLLDYGRAIRH